MGGHEVVEHAPIFDINWTAVYIIVFVIPVIFLAIALYDVWQVRRVRKSGDLEASHARVQAEWECGLVWQRQELAQTEGQRAFPWKDVHREPKMARAPKRLRSVEAGTMASDVERLMAWPKLVTPEEARLLGLGPQPGQSRRRPDFEDVRIS